MSRICGSTMPKYDSRKLIRPGSQRAATPSVCISEALTLAAGAQLNKI